MVAKFIKQFKFLKDATESFSKSNKCKDIMGTNKKKNKT